MPTRVSNFSLLPKEITVNEDGTLLLNISSERIEDDAISTGKIVNLNVTTDKIADTAITTAKITDDAVTNDKIQNPFITIGTSELVLGQTFTDVVGLNQLIFNDENTTFLTLNRTSITAEIETTITNTLNANAVVVDNITTDDKTIQSVDDLNVEATKILNLKTLSVNSNIFLIPNGDGVVDVPAGYEARINFNDNSLTNKKYVDAVATGLNIKQSAKAATIANIGDTYSNGTNGLGATLVSTNNGALDVDGITSWVTTAGSRDRILVKDQTDPIENGIYEVVDGGSASTTWQLIRTSDADEPAELSSGTFVFVASGFINGNKGFVASHDGDPSIGVDDISFDQFSGAGGIIAGEAIAKDNDTLNVVYDNVTIGLDTSQVPALTIKSLPDDVVTTASIADSAVDSDRIANQAVRGYDAIALESREIAPLTIMAQDISTNAIITSKIADDAVTKDKLYNVVTLTIYNEQGQAIKTLYGAGDPP